MAHVVELFGAPGTGKSSLARALVSRSVTVERLTRLQHDELHGLLRECCVACPIGGKPLCLVTGKLVEPFTSALDGIRVAVQ